MNEVIIFFGECLNKKNKVFSDRANAKQSFEISDQFSSNFGERYTLRANGYREIAN
jgi:hypothetical protein